MLNLRLSGLTHYASTHYHYTYYWQIPAFFTASAHPSFIYYQPAMPKLFGGSSSSDFHNHGLRELVPDRSDVAERQGRRPIESVSFLTTPSSHLEYHELIFTNTQHYLRPRFDRNVGQHVDRTYARWSTGPMAQGAAQGAIP